jgi:hypothetical protein
MDARVLAVMAANRGLLTRAQALDAGLDALTLRHLLRLGTLVVVRRGVYADGAAWAELDEYNGRHRLRTRAATMLMRRGFVISHDSAAYEHGLEILQPPDPHVHITRQGVTGAWTKAGVKHHLAGFGKEQLVVIDGLEVLDMARTAVDIAREHGTPYGEVACDSALRHGVSRGALMEAYGPMRNWQHVRRTRKAVEFADPGAESVVETLGRLLVTSLGIGEVDTQFPARLENGRVVWGDIRVGCHLFEVDGKVKYVPTSEGGLADQPAHEVVWSEKKRERDLAREGLGVSRIFFQDYWPPHRDKALARMRAEFEETVARFGTELPERLVRNAREIRGRRGA